MSPARSHQAGFLGRLASIGNRCAASVFALGVLPNYLVALVVGRRSGRVITLPLVMAVVENERFLVSMLGENVSWVHNLRAAQGLAVLRHGRREQVRLEAVPVEARPPVLKAYLKRSVGARPHIPVRKDAQLSEFEKIAALIPVFRVTAAT